MEPQRSESEFLARDAAALGVQLARMEAELAQLSRAHQSEGRTLGGAMERLTERVHRVEVDLAGLDRRIIDAVDRNVKRFALYLAVPLALVQALSGVAGVSPREVLDAAREVARAVGEAPAEPAPARRPAP